MTITGNAFQDNLNWTRKKDKAKNYKNMEKVNKIVESNSGFAIAPYKDPGSGASKDVGK